MDEEAPGGGRLQERKIEREGEREREREREGGSVTRGADTDAHYVAVAAARDE
jgi:hypothetical protein